MKSANAHTTERSASVVNLSHVASEGGLVDSAYRELRKMAITLRLPPGERLNEANLTKELGVSRTPLREAQNRLLAEGFLTFSVNQGFFRRPLYFKEILDLYEFRQHLEMAAVRLVVERATDKQLLDLERLAQENSVENVDRKLDEVIALDEEFHERLITLTGNDEMWNRLRNINEHIHCVRWINMSSESSEFKTPHLEIVRALRERNTEEGIRLVGEHIGHRCDQIVQMIEGYSLCNPAEESPLHRMTQFSSIAHLSGLDV